MDSTPTQRPDDSGGRSTMQVPKQNPNPSGFATRPQGPPGSPRFPVNNGAAGGLRLIGQQQPPNLHRLDSRSSIGPPPGSAPQFLGQPRQPFVQRPTSAGAPPGNFPRPPQSYAPNQGPPRFPPQPATAGIRGPVYPPPGQRVPFSQVHQQNIRPRTPYSPEIRLPNPGSIPEQQNSARNDSLARGTPVLSSKPSLEKIPQEKGRMEGNTEIEKNDDSVSAKKKLVSRTGNGEENDSNEDDDDDVVIDDQPSSKPASAKIESNNLQKSAPSPLPQEKLPSVTTPEPKNPETNGEISAGESKSVTPVPESDTKADESTTQNGTADKSRPASSKTPVEVPEPKSSELLNAPADSRSLSPASSVGSNVLGFDDGKPRSLSPKSPVPQPPSPVASPLVSGSPKPPGTPKSDSEKKKTTFADDVEVRDDNDVSEKIASRVATPKPGTRPVTPASPSGEKSPIRPGTSVIEKPFIATLASTDKPGTRPTTPAAAEKPGTRPTTPAATEKSGTRPTTPAAAEKSETRQTTPAAAGKSETRPTTPAAAEKSGTRPTTPAAAEKSGTRPTTPAAEKSRTATPAGSVKSGTRPNTPAVLEKPSTRSGTPVPSTLSVEKPEVPNICDAPKSPKTPKRCTSGLPIKSDIAENGTSQANAQPTTNGVAVSPTKKLASKSRDGDKSKPAASQVKSPSKSIKSLPRTPEAGPPSTEKKKLPMNKVQVGAAPSPNLKTVRSKVGSLDNTSYKPGGGKVKIENRKLDFSNAQAKIAAKNDKYTPSGGDKKITQVKLQWNAKPKVGSLDNATYKPGGGDKKIETVKLDFKDKAKPKVGSKDNAKHVPGGGTVKSTATPPKTPQESEHNIETQKIDIKAESKIGSLDNVKHRPGGGDKKIFDDKTYLRQTSSNVQSVNGSGTQEIDEVNGMEELRDYEEDDPNPPPSTPTKSRPSSSVSTPVTPEAVKSSLRTKSPDTPKKVTITESKSQAATPRATTATLNKSLQNGVQTPRTRSPKSPKSPQTPKSPKSPIQSPKSPIQSPKSPRPPSSLDIKSPRPPSSLGIKSPDKSSSSTSSSRKSSPKGFILPQLTSPVQFEAAVDNKNQISPIKLPKLIESSTLAARAGLT